MKATISQKKALFLLITCLPFALLGQSNSSIWGDNNTLQQPVNNDPIWNSQQASAGSVNADSDGIAPPPEDPIDVPIDGGVGILLMIGIGIGYKNSKKRRNEQDSNVYNDYGKIQALLVENNKFLINKRSVRLLFSLTKTSVRDVYYVVVTTIV